MHALDTSAYEVTFSGQDVETFDVTLTEEELATAAGTDVPQAAWGAGGKRAATAEAV